MCFVPLLLSVVIFCFALRFSAKFLKHFHMVIHSVSANKYSNSTRYGCCFVVASYTGSITTKSTFFDSCQKKFDPL